MQHLNCIKSSVRRLAVQQGGYSIIEVMISLAIFAIGIMSVATLQILSTNGNTNARKCTEASEIAQGQIEALMAMPFANVVDDIALTADGYTLQWTIVNQRDMDGDGNNDIIEIQVIVNDANRKKKADFSFKKAADF